MYFYFANDFYFLNAVNSMWILKIPSRSSFKNSSNENIIFILLVN